MLAADKLQLQSLLKQQATALKEKEFNLHHSNLMTVGTQAAVLAGLDITMFIEFSPPGEAEWGEYMHIGRTLKMCYFGVIVGAFCANMLVVAHCTALSVLGAGLALRGPDGSMMVATDGLYEERKTVFRIFALGLALTVGSVLLSVWLLLYWEAALVCWLLTLMTLRQMYRNYVRVSQRFGYDESLTVDFRDIMEGPAAIMAVPSTVRYAARAIQETVAQAASGKSSSKKYRRHRDSSSSSDDYDDDDDDDNSYTDEESAVELKKSSSQGNIKRRGTVNGRRKLEPMETV